MTGRPGGGQRDRRTRSCRGVDTAPPRSAGRRAGRPRRCVTRDGSGGRVTARSTSVTPGCTSSPCAQWTAVTIAVARRAHRQLHLHRFEHQHRVAFCDRLARVDEQLDRPSPASAPSARARRRCSVPRPGAGGAISTTVTRPSTCTQHRVAPSRRRPPSADACRSDAPRAGADGVDLVRLAGNHDAAVRVARSARARRCRRLPAGVAMSRADPRARGVPGIHGSSAARSTSAACRAGPATRSLDAPRRPRSRGNGGTRTAAVDGATSAGVSRSRKPVSTVAARRTRGCSSTASRNGMLVRTPRIGNRAAPRCARPIAASRVSACTITLASIGS